MRTDERWLVALAAAIGIIAGLAVAAMTTTVGALHHVLYQLPDRVGLSAASGLHWQLALAVPCIGGLWVGLVTSTSARLLPRRTVDPVEANALYGGRMSLLDSLLIVLQTVLSNGVGASVGLEAGYTQLGSAVASKLGQSFRVRRADLRILVGCGAAGAIGAAFDAPLAGAFYAYELIIATYSLATVAPVITAAVFAVSTMHLIMGNEGGFEIHAPLTINASDDLPLLALVFLCAFGGIAIMRSVTAAERLFRWSGLPLWLRPTVGGLVVGAMALVSPTVLSSGHSALRPSLEAPLIMSQLALLIGLKGLASLISIAAGFRGGLFFASLFLGALTGKLVAAIAATTVVPAPSAAAYALVGMSSFATAVVGGPLTMTFLALESTGSVPIMAAALVGTVITSVLVRRTFGYSFTTWRFHLRGEVIRSAVDVGWMRDLTAGRIMRREFVCVPVHSTLAKFRLDIPLASHTHVIALASTGRYAGIVTVSDAYVADEEVTQLSDIVRHGNAMLLPQMTIKECMAMFESTESDALAVVDDLEMANVVGVLTESHALRRYAEELEKRRRELAGA